MSITSTYKIIFDGKEQDEVSSTTKDAEKYARHLCSCTREGTEILHMSNSGNYAYYGGNFENSEYEIVERD